MSKDIVIRLHVYLMCFLLSFSTPYAYASAAPKLDFVGIANFVRDAGGATADYIFKRAANDPNYNAANDDFFDAKNHRVSNSALSNIGLDRMKYNKMLVGGVGGVLVGFAIDELINAMQTNGWTVDTVNHEVYKYVPVGNWCPVLVGFTSCFPTPEQAAQEYCNEYMRKYPSSSCAVGSELSRTDTRVTYTRLLNGNPSANITVNRDDDTLLKVHATPDDVAEVLPEVSDTQIQELMKSPDYQSEPHAPTAAAAAKAQPASAPSCPVGQTKVDGVCKPDEDTTGKKCPAGQVYDAETKQCKSTAAAQCPAGQVYDPVQKKCVALKLPEEDEDDWPEFCEWAAPVCDFIEWAKHDVYKFDVESVDVKDTADDAESITSEILTLGYVSGGIKSCPVDYTFEFSVMGQSIDFELSYQPLCDMLETARPVVIALAYFQAAKIVFLGRRD